MSLGVLNNLSALQAANNLNNTQNSLSKTLQQLSSGSKINGGADDAAGLSLVNGLQANSQALAQSQTNAQEGVGLLQVADGALSQVTNLLNRAVTLATEVSNGTLNGSQQTAANQEYQSILSEINNIGSTTTYNQQQVFNSNTQIYVGDSSTSGASVDQLNIRALSSSNVGDSGGAISYSANGNSSNVFINLAHVTAAGSTTKNASITDTLNATAGGTTITINTLSSTGAVVGNKITVGGTSGYANTAQGMIQAINASGLGLTASWTTAAVAGASVAGTSAVVAAASQLVDKGIMITGSVGVGSTPTTASFSGTAGAAGSSTTGDIYSGSITFQVGTGAAQTVTMAQVAAADHKAQGSVSLDDLVKYINTNTALGVNATDTVGSGTITFQSSSTNTPALKVTSNLTDQSIASGPTAVTYTATSGYSDGVSSDTYANNGIGDSTSGDTGSSTVTQIVNGTAGTSGGVATINFSDKAGQSLSSTDLSNQTDAQSALTALNSAIAAVASQDGYIGAQINTLNAVSSVLSTQQQNVIAAQNAVQATDYAQASSNMSKYQILSQTGISALAQANSMAQEVTKLLQ